MGVLSTMGCLGSCIPYLGTIFMFLSWFTTVMGVITGAAGVVVAQQADRPATLGGIGLGLNLAVILLWVAYMVFVFGLVAVLMGGVILAETL